MQQVGRPEARRRAREAWDALSTSSLRSDSAGRPLVRARTGGPVATLWPFSQVLHAAVLVDAIEGIAGIAGSEGSHGLDGGGRGGELLRGLEAYRKGPAYAARRRRPRRPRYYDDNAWAGLAAAQSGLLGAGGGSTEPAGRLLAWVRSGEAPSGGVRWREGRPALHSCSTGSVGLLALRARTPPAPDDVRLAARCRDFLVGPMCRTDGLVADHIDAHGQVEPTAWSYNQGLAVGLEVLLHRLGDDRSLPRARSLAHAADRHLAEDDRLWRQPPCFVAVYLRMLLLLHSEDGDPRWRRIAEGYLDRVWAEARTASDGFDGGGIGGYGSERTLDLAGITQVAALLALEPELLRLVC